MSSFFERVRDWFRRAPVSTPRPAARPGSVPRPAAAAAAPKAKASASDGAGRERERVTVGLDFGTHSTKVVIRQGMQPEAEVMLLDHPASNAVTFDEFSDGPYPWFVAPSLVRIDGGKVFFGKDARCECFHDRYINLKVCLLAESPPLSDEKIRLAQCESSTEAVDLLVTAYLTWCLGRVREQLEQRWGPDGALPFVQVGAPMDHEQDQALKDRYLRLLGAAWHLAMTPGATPIAQGESLEALKARIAPLLTRDDIVPPQDVRTFTVLPETIASLVPLGQDPHWGPDAYTIVDIGGGSTEVSVSLVRMDGRGVLSCYSDATTPYGGHALRRESVAPLPGERSVVDEILLHRSRTWELAYRKDGRSKGSRRPWYSNTLLYAGGGWGDTELIARMHEDDPARAKGFPDEHYRYAVKEYVPSAQALKLGGGPFHPNPATREDFRFLAVALGLSIRAPRWPRWFEPDSIGETPADPYDGWVDPFHGHA